MHDGCLTLRRTRNARSIAPLGCGALPANTSIRAASATRQEGDGGAVLGERQRLQSLPICGRGEPGEKPGAEGSRGYCGAAAESLSQPGRAVAPRPSRAEGCCLRSSTPGLRAPLNAGCEVLGEGASGKEGSARLALAGVGKEGGRAAGAQSRQHHGRQAAEVTGEGLVPVCLWTR